MPFCDPRPRNETNCKRWNPAYKFNIASMKIFVSLGNDFVTDTPSAKLYVVKISFQINNSLGNCNMTVCNFASYLQSSCEVLVRSISI